jgi:hypothetical protein
MVLHDLRTTSWVSMNNLVLIVISFPIMDSSRETESCAIVLISTWTVVSSGVTTRKTGRWGSGPRRPDKLILNASCGVKITGETVKQCSSRLGCKAAKVQQSLTLNEVQNEICENTHL